MSIIRKNASLYALSGHVGDMPSSFPNIAGACGTDSMSTVVDVVADIYYQVAEKKQCVVLIQYMGPGHCALCSVDEGEERDKKTEVYSSIIDHALPIRSIASRHTPARSSTVRFTTGRCHLLPPGWRPG